MAFLLDCLKLLDYQNGICILTHPLYETSIFYFTSPYLTTTDNQIVIFLCRNFICLFHIGCCHRISNHKYGIGRLGSLTVKKHLYPPAHIHQKIVCLFYTTHLDFLCNLIQATKSLASIPFTLQYSRKLFFVSLWNCNKLVYCFS